MFGKRSNDPSAARRTLPAQEASVVAKPAEPKIVALETRAPARQEIEAHERRHSEEYYDVKTTVFNALIDTIDLTQLAKLEAAAAREEIRDIVSEIIQIKNVVMSIAEQEELLEDICNDVLGYGPLEPLLARDDIADIMVNGANTTYIEVGGKVQKTPVRFADNAQLMNVCQRIVSQVGRRVDESSPICDARLPDGSRVNVIAPPLAIDGPTLTIRKFKKDRLKLEQLVKYKSITPEAKTILEIIGRVRCNVLISGGTGSGKTTLLNCMTGSIDMDERIITCEDSAELQLQQPHVVRLETRPPNLEGEGEITMRDLVRNCLRMRPERIIVGEVRGPEAFDLLQAMNTGHDGSMGTLHANSPREAISRLESMIMMGGFQLPPKTIREMITGSIDVIIQASRLRDGSRKVTHVTEVMGMEGDVVTLQNIIVFEITGEDAQEKIVGRHRSTGIARPRFWERAEYYGETKRLAEALSAAEVRDPRGQPMGDGVDNDLMLAGLLALAAASVGAVVYLLLFPYISGEHRTDKRIQSASENKGRRIALKQQAEATNNRRRQVAETLKDLEDRQKQREKVSLRLRLQRAGLDTTPRTFWIASVACGLIVGLGIWVTAPNLPMIVPMLGAFVGVLGLPRWILARLTKRRLYKFTDEFANAIDVIVRGVKSGLPLVECLNIIARESPQPISGEFTELVEQQRVGVPLAEAFDRMMVRVPLAKVRFFAIVIAIQQQAGGNLSEALGNLSGVLRDRKRLQAKVRALSAEAKASAAVLGALPFVVMILVYITTPSYIALLWSTRFGQFLLAAGGCWMTCGILVMKKMINFKY